MKKFFFILNRKLTIGNALTIIGSLIFAVLLRHFYLYCLDFLPVRGELGVLDISYFGIVASFKFIFSAFLEYWLDDKFSIHLFETIGQKQVTTLSMVNSDPQSSSVDNSSKGKNTITKQEQERQRESYKKFIDEQFRVGDKMWDVLDEQINKILKLGSIKSQKDVKFYQEDGSLELSVPEKMSDTEANKLSKEVGALDRSLQNKFSEYNNLSRKDVRLYDSMWSSTYKEIWDNNQVMYKELFEKNA